MTNPTFTTRANDQQQKAITTTEGPLLIIAGPGSGKTFTLVERIVYLITQKNVEPENLMVVTFTEKAAAELTTRISNRLHQLNIRFNLNEMYLGTFHSICLRWLRDYREHTRLKRNFNLMDQFDQQYFFYQKMRHFDEVDNIEMVYGKKSDSGWKKSQQLVKWINTVSEEFLDLEKLAVAEDGEIRALGRAAALYNRLIEEENTLDFSTIQAEALRLLQNHPHILAELRQKISYLMVDEYQDTNTIQDLLLRQLAPGDAPNLCVVGDDDQGLYRFRGATIRNILQFPKKFPRGTCAQVELTINYRSHPDIVSFNNDWIEDIDWTDAGIKFRYDKQMEPRQDTFSSVPAVLKVGDVNADRWHKSVLQTLHSLRDEGNLTDWNQVAFLFNSVKHHETAALAQFLEQNNIPVYAPRANQFFEREEIKLMMGAILMMFPQYPHIRKWNDDAKLRIWDYYDKECLPLFIEQIRQPENRELLTYLQGRGNTHKALKRNTNYAFSGLFYELLQFPMFSRYLEPELLKSNMRDSRAIRNLAIFSQLLNKFEYLHHINILTVDMLEHHIKTLFNGFFRFLKDGGIDEYEDTAEYAPSGTVSFLTIHQSKGLEFPVVFVGSLKNRPTKRFKPLEQLLEEGNYLSRPSFEPLEKTKFYDFQRLYYTAFSRAQNLLFLTALEVDGSSWPCPSKAIKPFYDRLQSWGAPTVDFGQVPLETIKEVNLKQEYSFTSHITVFENCAEQYRFFKELEFAPVRKSPILFGTLVHQTIEDIHRAVLTHETAKLNKGQIGAWFDTNYAWLTKKERVYLSPAARQIALNHVLRYFRANRADWSHIREAEVDVSLVKEGYILAGTIDLIQGEGDTVELVDFKSEKKLDVNDPKDQEKLDQYRRQLEVYAHIVEERTGLEVSGTNLYYTGVESGNPLIKFDKDSRAIDQTIGTFDRVVDRIELKDFAIEERPVKICDGCDLRAYCDTKAL